MFLSWEVWIYEVKRLGQVSKYNVQKSCKFYKLICHLPSRQSDLTKRKPFAPVRRRVFFLKRCFHAALRQIIPAIWSTAASLVFLGDSMILLNKNHRGGAIRQQALS
jgi:hypothetical protein